MGIVYLITILLLLVLFILIKKTEKEIDIISFIGISIVSIFCYNTLICYVLTFFTIPIKLWLLASINLFISFIFLIKIIQNKEIQKYTLKKIDLLYVFLIALVVIGVSYWNFGFPFDIKYETGDPSVHYLTSIMFAEEEQLLANSDGDYVYGSFNTRKTTSYVNSGLLMKCFVHDSDPIKQYNIFVIFGAVTLFFTGMVMFSTLTNHAKNDEHRFWAFIISLICILGYPLNSFLFGFEYLSMGLLIICAILGFMHYYDISKISINYFIILMFLMSFGLFSAYYMFVPFIYPAMWLYFCIKNYYKTKKLITKELIVLLFVTLLLPFVLGFIYHLAPNIYAVIINQNLDTSKVWDYSNYIAGDGLAVNGYIYINLYSNMLLLLPLVIYFFVKKALDKDLKSESFIGLLIIFAILFIELLLIGHGFEKVSIYYLSKNYFALWIILLYCNYKALIQLAEKSNYLSRLFISAYVFLMVVCTIFSNAKMINALNNPNENILTVMEIFGVNKDILMNKKSVYNQKELEILMYVHDNIDYCNKIEFASDDTTWTYAILRYINKENDFEGKKYGETYLVSKWLLLPEKINNVDYIVYFDRSKMFNLLKNEYDLFKNSEIIYENEAGGILKYNN